MTNTGAPARSLCPRRAPRRSVASLSRAMRSIHGRPYRHGESPLSPVVERARLRACARSPGSIRRSRGTRRSLPGARSGSARRAAPAHGVERRAHQPVARHRGHDLRVVDVVADVRELAGSMPGSCEQVAAAPVACRPRPDSSSATLSFSARRSTRATTRASRRRSRRRRRAGARRPCRRAPRSASAPRPPRSSRRLRRSAHRRRRSPPP